MTSWKAVLTVVLLAPCHNHSASQPQPNHKVQSSILKVQSFQSPVDYDISLAGNFGEPRPHHFHGGLDIRTEGVEGKHIYAIADGYVSRITMGKNGFGNAIYITHPTGQTSIYAHLKAFSPRIKAALRRYQYQHKTCEADARLKPADVPVSRGQFIALSGNTGNSTAPHLHLEVRDTHTGNMLDPYQFLDDFIQDTVPPQAHGFMAIPLGGTFNGSPHPSTFIANWSTLNASGPVGFAIWADDYMQGSYNHYGIHETLLYADGQMVFHSVVDDIPPQQNGMVNSWGCYDYWMSHRTWYMKSYREPGNTLGCLRTDEHRGIITFADDRDYHLEYVLRDFKGNEARYGFTVKGTPPSKPTAPSKPPRGEAFLAAAMSPSGDSRGALLRWNRTNSYSLPGVQLVVPYGRLAADTPLSPRVIRQPDAWSDAYQFAGASLPLMANAELSVYVHPSGNVAGGLDPSKFYITDENGRYHGGDFHNGWVTGRVRELAGVYEVAYDDCPPRVKPVSTKGGRLLLSVIDSESGIASWTATVDGRFIVFDAIEKSTSFACELGESWLPRSGNSHRLSFTVTDHRHNSTTYETTFDY